MNNKLLKSRFNIKRAVAFALSMVLTANNTVLGAETEDKIKTLAKEHPIITSGAAATGGISLLVGLTFGIIQLRNIIKNSQVHTPVDNIPEAEIQNYLNSQIDIFENYGKDGGKNLFVVSDEIKREASPRVLALVIKSINMVFEKDALFLNALKTKLKKGNNTFQIDWGEDNMYHEFFCSLSTLDYPERPYTLKINKTYGQSFGKAKNYAKNRQSPQRAVVWNIGQFFEECIIQKSQQLTIDRVFELAQARNPALNKNNAQFSKEVFARCFPVPFADLLADYILEEYPQNDIFMEIFSGHLNALKGLSENASSQR